MARKWKLSSRAGVRGIIDRVRRRWQSHGHDGIAGLNETNLNRLIKYLSNFGHLKPEATTVDDLISAIKSFQRLIPGLKNDGVAGPITMRAMELPRCEVREQARTRRGFWGLKTINYFISKYVAGISKADQRDIFTESYRDITRNCDLKFHQVSDRDYANVVINVSTLLRFGFGRGGGTLASAELAPVPNFEGYGSSALALDFDGAEIWTADVNAIGVLLLPVHKHETLHNLGFGHNTGSKKTILAPFYNKTISMLQPADIAMLQKTYGADLITGDPSASKGYTLEVDGSMVASGNFTERANLQVDLTSPRETP